MHWLSYLRWRDFFPWWRRYNNEPNRALFIREHYSAWLVGDILDVGCGTSAPYYRAWFGKRYQGLDRAGSYYFSKAEHLWNVEKAPLPFEPDAFDTVLCIGSLEHLDNPHEVYEELFRVAKCYVLIQLPNNWPGFFSDFLVGHNYSHTEGYGLKRKLDGHRHKWFFNLEEACEFLTSSIPAGWKLMQLDCTFEKGNDSWFAWKPYQRLSRYTLMKGLYRWSASKALIVYLMKPLIVYPIQAIEWLIGLLIWGWRGRVVYHNLMCREIWAIYERDAGSKSIGPIAARSIPILDEFPVPILVG